MRPWPILDQNALSMRNCKNSFGHRPQFSGSVEANHSRIVDNHLFVAFREAIPGFIRTGLPKALGQKSRFCSFKEFFRFAEINKVVGPSIHPALPKIDRVIRNEPVRPLGRAGEHGYHRHKRQSEDPNTDHPTQRSRAFHLRRLSPHRNWVGPKALRKLLDRGGKMLCRLGDTDAHQQLTWSVGSKD